MKERPAPRREPPPEKKETPEAKPPAAPPRVVFAKRPNELWHVDVTTIAIGSIGCGFFTAWWPFALIQRWFLSWHIALVLDHYSRAFVAFGVFRQQPSATQMCRLLSRAIQKTGATPRYIVSDQGTQFQSEYSDWCRERGIRPRFGAIGKHGSIAVIERFILSLKNECLRRIIVPLEKSRLEQEISAYQLWYNTERAHSTLEGRTPAERTEGAKKEERVRFEPRERVAIGDGVTRVSRLDLHVSFLRKRRHLPVVRLREAA